MWRSQYVYPGVLLKKAPLRRTIYRSGQNGYLLSEVNSRGDLGMDVVFLVYAYANIFAQVPVYCQITGSLTASGVRPGIIHRNEAGRKEYRRVSGYPRIVSLFISTFNPFSVPYLPVTMSRWHPQIALSHLTIYESLSWIVAGPRVSFPEQSKADDCLCRRSKRLEAFTTLSIKYYARKIRASEFPASPYSLSALLRPCSKFVQNRRVMANIIASISFLPHAPASPARSSGDQVGLPLDPSPPTLSPSGETYLPSEKLESSCRSFRTSDLASLSTHEKSSKEVKVQPLSTTRLLIAHIGWSRSRNFFFFY